MNKHKLKLILYPSAFIILFLRGYYLYRTLTLIPSDFIPMDSLVFSVGEIVGLALLFIFLDRFLDSYGE